MMMAPKYQPVDLTAPELQKIAGKPRDVRYIPHVHPVQPFRWHPPQELVDQIKLVPPPVTIKRVG